MKRAFIFGLSALWTAIASAQPFVLFGDGYDPKPNDTYVKADSITCPVGEHSSLIWRYMAQTFKATGKHPQTITLGLADLLPSDVPPAPFRFRLLITEVTDTSFKPGAILWESRDLSVPIRQSGYKEYTYRLRDVTFEPGRIYAWVIDTYSASDGNQDAGCLFINIGQTAPLYLEGNAFFAPASGAGRDVDFQTASWVPLFYSGSFLIRHLGRSE